MKNYIGLPLFIIMIQYATTGVAQFTFDGQYMQRAEYRHGYGQLIQQNQEYAALIGHRARIQGSWKKNRLTMYMSAQDVRIWGNTPQLKSSDGLLSVHEAWCEYGFSDTWSMKLGRQELNYDNVRFLGNVDWLFQARAHDFALVKFEKNNHKLHFGGGFNQNQETLNGNILHSPNQYKAAQFVRYENKWEHFALSALFWNDGRQFIRYDTTNTLVAKSIHYRSTIGLPQLRYTSGNSVISGFVYYQFGKDLEDRTINAWNANIQVTQTVPVNKEKERQLRATLGVDAISGTPKNNRRINRSYSPLYGTNHAHNGYMDLFFVGGRFEHSIGLMDYYLRSRYDFNKRLFMQGDVHYFHAQAKTALSNGTTGQYLGTEVDITIGYLLNSDVSFQAGYSQMFADDNFKILTNTNNAKSIQNWSYLMFIYRPNMTAKFVGLLL